MDKIDEVSDLDIRDKADANLHTVLLQRTMGNIPRWQLCKSVEPETRPHGLLHWVTGKTKFEFKKAEE